MREINFSSITLGFFRQFSSNRRLSSVFGAKFKAIISNARYNPFRANKKVFFSFLYDFLMFHQIFWDYRNIERDFIFISLCYLFTKIA